MQKTLFGGSSFKMPKVKNYFFCYYILYLSLFKNKKKGNVAFFKLETFNCKVSFYRLTLTTVIVILSLKFEEKCYC